LGDFPKAGQSKSPYVFFKGGFNRSSLFKDKLLMILSEKAAEKAKAISYASACLDPGPQFFFPLTFPDRSPILLLEGRLKREGILYQFSVLKRNAKFDGLVKSPKMSLCERSEAIQYFLTH